jgi:hypothetical protein
VKRAFEAGSASGLRPSAAFFSVCTPADYHGDTAIKAGRNPDALLLQPCGVELANFPENAASRPVEGATFELKTD